MRVRTPADCPAGLMDLALWCVKIEPEERPGFKEIIRQLRDIEQTLPPLPVFGVCLSVCACVGICLALLLIFLSLCVCFRLIVCYVIACGA